MSQYCTSGHTHILTLTTAAHHSLGQASDRAQYGGQQRFGLHCAYARARVYVYVCVCLAGCRCVRGLPNKTVDQRLKRKHIHLTI